MKGACGGAGGVAIGIDGDRVGSWRVPRCALAGSRLRRARDSLSSVMALTGANVRAGRGRGVDFGADMPYGGHRPWSWASWVTSSSRTGQVGLLAWPGALWRDPGRVPRGRCWSRSWLHRWSHLGPPASIAAASASPLGALNLREDRTQCSPGSRSEMSPRRRGYRVLR